jgi:hypothetical protein
MKMENILRAERKATVSAIKAGPGESLAVDDVILEFVLVADGIEQVECVVLLVDPGCLECLTCHEVHGAFLPVLDAHVAVDRSWEGGGEVL